MKFKSFFLIGLMFILSLVMASMVSALTNANIVAYWAFNDTSGNITDYGTGKYGINNLTAYGSPTYQITGVGGGKAVNFSSGITNYANKASPTGLPSGASNWTVSLWFNGPFQTADNYGYFTAFGTYTTNQLVQFGFDSSNNVIISGYGGGNDWQTDESLTTEFSDGKWHHLVLRWGSNIGYLYIDGVYRESWAHAKNVGTTFLSVNRQGAGTSGSGNVSIDEYYFFNNSINDASCSLDAICGGDIATLYGGGNGWDITPPNITTFVPANGSTSSPVNAINLSLDEAGGNCSIVNWNNVTTYVNETAIHGVNLDWGDPSGGGSCGIKIRATENITITGIFYDIVGGGEQNLGRTTQRFIYDNGTNPINWTRSGTSAVGSFNLPANTNLSLDMPVVAEGSCTYSNLASGFPFTNGSITWLKGIYSGAPHASAWNMISINYTKTGTPTNNNPQSVSWVYDSGNTTQFNYKSYNASNVSQAVSLSNGQYYYNVSCWDSALNNNSGNYYTFTVGSGASGNISVTLNSPANTTYTSNITLNFSYTPKSYVNNISNATLHIWSGHGDVVNASAVVNNSANLIEATLSDNNLWYWNVEVCDILGFCFQAPANFTLTIHPYTNISNYNITSSVFSEGNRTLWNSNGNVIINSNTLSLTLTTGQNANCSGVVDTNLNYSTAVATNPNYKFATTTTTSHAYTVFDTYTGGNHCLYVHCVNYADQNIDTSSGCLNFTYVKIDWLYNISNISVNEYSSTITYLTNLSSYVNDTGGYSTTFSIKSENTSQVDCNITGNNLILSPFFGWYGNATCIIGVNDSIGANGLNQTLGINVIYVNDVPVWVVNISNITLMENFNSYTYITNLSDYVTAPVTNEFIFSIQAENTSQVDCEILGVDSPNICYQETANVSTVCGGLSTGNYYSTNTDSYVYINYSKLINSMSTSSWRVKYGYNISSGQAIDKNFSIPSDCWSQNNLQYRFYSSITPFLFDNFIPSTLNLSKFYNYSAQSTYGSGSYIVNGYLQLDAGAYMDTGRTNEYGQMDIYTNGTIDPLKIALKSKITLYNLSMSGQCGACAHSESTNIYTRIIFTNLTNDVTIYTDGIVAECDGGASYSHAGNNFIIEKLNSTHWYYNYSGISSGNVDISSLTGNIFVKTSAYASRITNGAAFCSSTATMKLNNITYVSPSSRGDCWNGSTWETVAPLVYGASFGTQTSSASSSKIWDADWTTGAKHNESLWSSTVDNEEAYSSLYEEAMNWDIKNVLILHSALNYNGTASCTIGTNNSVGWGENRTFYIGVLDRNVYLNLDGLFANRTYEYGTTANVSIVSVNSDNLSVGSDVYMVGKGIDYFIGVSNTTFNASYDLSLINTNKINEFSDNSTSILLKYRLYNYEAFYVELPNYITITSASLDVSGLNSDQTLFGWDDMYNNEVTSKTYNFTDNGSMIFNLTLRDKRQQSGTGNTQYIKFASIQFMVQSSSAYNISVTIPNITNSLTIYNSENYLQPSITIVLDESYLNNWITNGNITVTDGIYTFPFNISVTTGGNITFSDFIIRLSYITYPEDLTIDIGDDGYVDINLSGMISTTSSSVNKFNESGSDFYHSDNGSSTSRTSSLAYIEVPSSTPFSTFTVRMRGQSSKDTYYEDFEDLDYINSSTTTCDFDAFFNQYSSEISGVASSCWIYSTRLDSNSSNITSLTVSIEQLNYLNTSTLNFYISNDNGNNWFPIPFNTYTSNSENVSFNTSGADVMWKANLKPTSSKKSYLYNLYFDGLGNRPHNVTLDVGNDGISDYNYTGNLPISIDTSGSNYVLINFNTSLISSAISSCTTPFCTFPINVSFDGERFVSLTDLSITYSVQDLNLDINPIKAYLTNAGSSLISNTTTPTSPKNVSTSKVSINAITDGVRVVKNATINITGSYYD